VPATRTALRTRSRIRALVGVLAAGLVLAACTGGDDDPPDPPRETSPSPSPSATTPDPVALTFAVSGTEEQVAAYAEVAQAFERTEPGVEVEVTELADTAAILETLDAAEGSPADVFLLDSDFLTGMVIEEGEAVRPLDELLEERGVAFGDDHQRVALTELSAEAALQCMPSEMSPLVVYANRDLLPPRRQLRSQGVVLPRATDAWTWAEFVTTARAVAASDDEAVRGTYLPISLDLVTAFVRGAGDEIVDDVFEPTRIDLTSDDDLEVMSQLAVLAADASVSLTPEEAERRSARDRFAEGALGMMIGTRADLPALRESRVKFQVMPLPHFGRYRAVSSVSGYCISAQSPHVEAAADFIAFAVSQQGATILAESGAVAPARLDVASSTAFTQPDQRPTNYRVYADAVRRSEPTPFAAEWPALSEQVGAQLSRILSDPTVDLGIELPRRLERLSRRSEQVLSPEETEDIDPGESGDAG
jgi:multiple sugar transport system substrate-binding protein